MPDLSERPLPASSRRRRTTLAPPLQPRQLRLPVPELAGLPAQPPGAPHRPGPAELGLEGCCGEPNQGAESTGNGFVLDGHQIEVWAEPLTAPAEATRPRELRVVSGQARYTFTEFNLARPDRRLLERASELLVERLYCTRNA